MKSILLACLLSFAFCFSFSAPAFAQVPDPEPVNGEGWGIFGAGLGLSLGGIAGGLLLDAAADSGDPALAVSFGIAALIAVGLPTVGGYLGGAYAAEEGHWNESLGYTLGAATAFGMLGAGLGFSAAHVAEASPLVRGLFAGAGALVMGAFAGLMEWMIGDRRERFAPVFVATGTFVIAGLLTALIAGIAGMENTGDDTLLIATAVGLAFGSLSFIASAIH